MKIIGFAGKKQSGKDTLGSFLASRFGGEKFYFASPIKAFCIEYLGLDGKLLYGSDEDKNQPTNITWGQMPHFASLVADNKFAWSDSDKLMTHRQVLQQVGNEWFRSIDPHIWVKKLFKFLEKYPGEIPAAYLCDVRFHNEMDAIHERGGKVIYLSRQAIMTDPHASEMEMETYKHYDARLENNNSPLAETKERLLSLLTSWGWA